ncbi:hypothetical protein [Salicibibacter kimchii]|nr:hypothetical protein [Salicibibacter kimchii]
MKIGIFNDLKNKWPFTVSTETLYLAAIMRGVRDDPTLFTVG